MGNLSVFDPWHAGELTVATFGKLSAIFTLADEIKNYAEMIYPGNRQFIATINSAQRSWTLHSGKNFFARDIFINDASTNQQAAVVKTSAFLARISIHFADGQIFNLKYPTVFSKTQRWYNDQFGNVLTTAGKKFTTQPKLKVIPGQSAFKNSDQLMLMIFISVHMVYMRKVYTGFVDDK